MNELEELMKLVADGKKEEAEKLSEKIKEKITSLDVEVNKQEKLKLDAIKEFDEATDKLKKVASDLGVSVIDDVPKAIKDIKEKKDDNTSQEVEIKDKEISKLKEEVETANAKIESNKKDHQDEITSTILEKDIISLLPKYKAKVNAISHIVDHVKKNADTVDGKIVYKNKDGTTLRAGGKDASLEDMIKSMQKAEKDSKESMFFNIGVQPSVDNDDGGGKITTGTTVPKF